MTTNLQHLQDLPARQSLLDQAGQSLSRTWSALQRSAATLYDYCKPKPAVAFAALLAGSVLGGTAQAAIVQLNLSGPSFSGYLFFDTTSISVDPFGDGQSYYSGFSYISTPFATGSTPPYTTNPVNIYTGNLLANNASHPYVFGQAFLVEIPSCRIGGCSYTILTSNFDNTEGELNFSIRQSTSENVLIDDPNSFAGTAVTFNLYTYGYDKILLDGIGTLSLPAASAVPEPATWAMMIVGFGLVGGAARHRRRRTTVAYA